MYQYTLDSYSQDQGIRFEVLHVSGRRGRPPFWIRRSHLEYLLSLGFTWTEMAALLGVSRLTLYRLDALYIMATLQLNLLVAHDYGAQFLFNSYTGVISLYENLVA